MSECEQIHPLLRGYLNETISARERRMVARHLNLCASARKELEGLRMGHLKPADSPVERAVEPWDLKILRWLFNTPKPVAPKLKETRPRKTSVQGMEGPSDRPSSLKPVLGVVFLFVALVFLTHFVQNAGENSVVKNAKRWISQKGWHVFGIQSSLELVLDLTKLPQWSGENAPVAFPYKEVIRDRDHLRIYWQLLQPGMPAPKVNFNENSLVIVFLGPKSMTGQTVKFKRSENYTDKTVLWYDEVSPAAGQTASTRPWVIQEVPKPSQEPVLIQQIQ